MTIMAYGPRYHICPDCHHPTSRTDQHLQRVGTWTLHAGCRLECGICGESIESPPIGQAYRVTAFCGQPAHADCKDEGAVTAVRAIETRELP